MQDKMECDWFKPSKHDVIHLQWFKTFKNQQKPNKKSQQKYLCLRHLKTKCEKCTIECIQNEKNPKQRHNKQTEDI